MRLVLVAAVLAVLMLPAAYAADGDPGAKGAGTPAAARGEDGKKDAAGESRGDRKKDAGAESRGDRKQDARPAPSPSGGSDDLVTCKRDADGMRGPERSRFMTRCLKERR